MASKKKGGGWEAKAAEKRDPSLCPALGSLSLVTAIFWRMIFLALAVIPCADLFFDCYGKIVWQRFFFERAPSRFACYLLWWKGMGHEEGHFLIFSRCFHPSHAHTLEQVGQRLNSAVGSSLTLDRSRAFIDKACFSFFRLDDFFFFFFFLSTHPPPCLLRKNKKGHY